MTRWLRSSFYNSLIAAFGAGIYLGRILTRHDARVGEVTLVAVFLLGVAIHSSRVLPFIPKHEKKARDAGPRRHSVGCLLAR